MIVCKENGLALHKHINSVHETLESIYNKICVNGLKQKLPNRDVLKWVSILHDLGKANPLFQENLNNGNFSNVCRHEISSILFNDIVPSEIRDIVSLVVLSHHKSINTDERSLYKLMDEREEELYKNHINNIHVWGQKVKDFLLTHYSIKCSIPSYEECVEKLEYYYDKIRTLEYDYSLYRGLFMMSDHFSSCYQVDDERKAILDSMFIKPDISCYNNIDYRFPLSMIESESGKRHTLCVAPTGVGKTNFMMKRTTGRVFYTLPYQASINSMYKRLNNDLGNEYLIGLKHSSLNTLSFVDENIKTLSSFYGMSVKVITPFQIMATILCLKGYESIIVDLCGQDVIFDELHTYDEKTKEYIFSMIGFLDKIGCRIHICTATMPSWMQTEIIEILGKENIQFVKLDDETLTSFERHIVHTVDNLDIEDIRLRYERGEKILIVNNQVNRAIDTFNMITKEIEGCKAMLLHSRFRRMDRDCLEGKLLEEFNGKDEGCIVVSTQVVEVSIDINFDVLYTDNADIMSLIQRFGRVNRQRSNVGVLKDVFIIRNNGNEHLPYNESVCKRTYEVMKSIDGKVLKETDIQKYIDEVHFKRGDKSYGLSNPYDEKGNWKQKMYTHVIDNSIMKEFEFEGYIGILEDDVDDYITKNDKKLEIPISKGITRYFTEVSVGKRTFYKIPEQNYSKILGLYI